MIVDVLLEEFGGKFWRLFWVGLCWKIGVDDVKGGGDYPMGVQLSTLNEVSGELSGGFVGTIVAEILG